MTRFGVHFGSYLTDNFKFLLIRERRRSPVGRSRSVGNSNDRQRNNQQRRPTPAAVQHVQSVTGRLWTCWSHTGRHCLKLKFHGSAFLVASSWHSRRHARHAPHPHEDATRISRVSGDFHVQLATRLPDWSTGSLLRYCASRLSGCRIVLQIPRARHAWLVADKSSFLVASSYRHVRHARFPRDMLAISSRGCHEDATRKLLPRNFWTGDSIHQRPGNAENQLHGRLPASQYGTGEAPYGTVRHHDVPCRAGSGVKEP